MTVKELKNNQRFEITDLKHKGMRLVFSKTESGKRDIHKYLCMIGKKGGKFYVQGMEPTSDIKILEENIQTYVSSLPYDSEYYNPLYKKGIFEERIIYDYMVSIGFKYEKDDLFLLNNKNIYNYVSHDIALTLSGYSAWGTRSSNFKLTKDVSISLWTGNYSWIEIKVPREVEAIKKGIDTLLKPLLLTDSVSCLTLSEKLKNVSNLDMTMNRLVGFSLQNIPYRETLKNKLQEVIAKL